MHHNPQEASHASAYFATLTKNFPAHAPALRLAAYALHFLGASEQPRFVDYLMNEASLQENGLFIRTIVANAPLPAPSRTRSRNSIRPEESLEHIHSALAAQEHWTAVSETRSALRLAYHALTFIRRFRSAKFLAHLAQQKAHAESSLFQSAD